MGVERVSEGSLCVESVESLSVASCDGSVASTGVGEGLEEADDERD